MAAWPTISAPTGLSITPGKPIKVQKSSAGYPMSYAGATVLKRDISLSWSAMSSADKATLETFFDENAGGTFTWTNPDDSTAYTVMFGVESLPFNYNTKLVGMWTLNLNLMEA